MQREAQINLFTLSNGHFILLEAREKCGEVSEALQGSTGGGRLSAEPAGEPAPVPRATGSFTRLFYMKLGLK